MIALSSTIFTRRMEIQGFKYHLSNIYVTLFLVGLVAWVLKYEARILRTIWVLGTQYMYTLMIEHYKETED